MRLLYRGAVHLAEVLPGGMVRILCAAVALPQFSPRWMGMPDDEPLTCKGCRAAEKRAAKKERSEA